MESPPICVAFLWHFHQPEYAWPGQERRALPWARLHAVKDYSDMAAWVEANPAVRVTFNWVPSLVQQILAYAEGRATDDLWEWSRRPAEALSLEERAGFLAWAFRGHPEGIIHPLPRYGELYRRLGPEAPEGKRREAARSWSLQDFRDLQVCHLLGWTGEALRRHHPLVRRLMSKQRGFILEEHQALLEVHREVLRGLLPRYRRLAQEGRVELSTSPFYHPILPLLCRMEDARVSRPDLPLPRARIAWKEDAREQLQRAKELHRCVFGSEPQGLWPSEGGVSDAALELAEALGFRWVASDEQILALTLHPQKAQGLGWPAATPRELYRPYRFRQGPALIFRDHWLSDRIGFDYASWRAEEAVEDLKRRLLRAQGESPSRPPLVAIILDGENAWEFYPHNGADFLQGVYAALSEDPRFRLVTISEYLEAYPPDRSLEHLFPGSWINHDFHIWVGHPEDNRAWEELATARLHLREREERLPREARRQAWEHVWVAEGSDWFWWYGEEHSSLDDPAFDALFRERVKAIYRTLGEEPPARLEEPIKRPRRPLEVEEPWQRLRVQVDGRITHYFEWLGAGRVKEPGESSMHRGLRWVGEVRFGFDWERYFWRVESAFGPRPEGRPAAEVWFLWETRQRFRLRVPWHRLWVGSLPLEGEGPGGWEELPARAEVGVGGILEVGVSWEALGLREGDAFGFVLEVHQRWEGGRSGLVERWPCSGWLTLTVPTREFETVHWWV